jgi:8-oxo-dGTP diphosphatase
MNKIKVVSDHRKLNAAYTSCIILTSDQKIMLQKNPATQARYPNHLSTIGGSIHSDETPLQNIIRELAEKVGAAVHPHDLIFLNAYTEEKTQHKDVVFAYFWHDKKARITGCYKGQACYINHLYELQSSPLIAEDVLWLIERCIQRKLISPNRNGI